MQKLDIVIFILQLLQIVDIQMDGEYVRSICVRSVEKHNMQLGRKIK